MIPAASRFQLPLLLPPSSDATPRPEPFQEAGAGVFSNQNLSAVIPNMVDEQRVKENLAVVGRSRMTTGIDEGLVEHFARLHWAFELE